MNFVKNDIDLLNKGILPDSFKFAETFAASKNTVIDVNKLKYNAFYKSFDYHASTFPDGYSSIKGFDKIIESIAENCKSPSEEMTDRQNIIIASEK